MTFTCQDSPAHLLYEGEVEGPQRWVGAGQEATVEDGLHASLIPSRQFSLCIFLPESCLFQMQ